MKNESHSPRKNSSGTYDHQMGGNPDAVPTRDIDKPRIKHYNAETTEPEQPKRRWHFGQRLRASLNEISEDADTTDYTPDRLNKRQFWVALSITAVLAAVGSLAAWLILSAMSLPAYSTSNVLRGLCTALSALIIAGMLGLLLWWVYDQYHDKPRSRWKSLLIRYYCYLAPAMLVVVNVALPLAATKLYLGGISVDQEFRTQYLTRLTDSAQLSDMNYLDLPTYYPAAWFWFGGRFANVLGLAGWEAFQPWSVVSLAVCASALTPLWQRLVGSLPVGTALAVTNTLIVLNFNAEEPYAAVVLLGAAVAVILANRAIAGSTSALIAVTLYLGVSATTYTLYTGMLALITVVLALVQARHPRGKWHWRPLARLGMIGVGALLIAAVAWGPYYLAVLTGNYERNSAATRYLPEIGTEVPLPMFSLTFMGLLCLAGLCYMIVRRKAPDILALGIALAITYGWVIASMLATVFGHSLLGFRLSGMVTLFLSTAGIFLVSDLRLLSMNRLESISKYPRRAFHVSAVFLTVFALGLLQFGQQIPKHHQSNIDLAYTDTDPTGARGNAYPADAGQYYADIDAYLREEGFVPSNTVVLTDEFEFLAYFPYRGFQALTAHYANPLGEFPLRNTAIEQWAEASWELSPEEFQELLESSQWAAPEVFIFQADSTELEDATNQEATDGDTAESAATDSDMKWSMDIAEDIFPNNPNVRWRALSFNPEVFANDAGLWKIHQIGSFAVVTKVS